MSERVRKFRSIEEMSAWQEGRRRETPMESFERFVNHCRRFIARRAGGFPAGVEKFRSLEEADDARHRGSRHTDTPPKH